MGLLGVPLRAVCSLRSSTVTRPCQGSTTKSNLCTGCLMRTEQLPGQSSKEIIIYKTDARCNQPAVSEDGQVCELRQQQLRQTAASDLLQCLLHTTYAPHIDCGDLLKLFDIHLDSHSIVPNWACTATTNSDDWQCPDSHRIMTPGYRYKVLQLASAWPRIARPSPTAAILRQCSHCIANNARLTHQ